MASKLHQLASSVVAEEGSELAEQPAELASSGVAEEGSEVAVQPAVVIRDVWKCNLEQEFANVRRLVRQYPYIAMDTEFPGVVARPLGDFNGPSAYQYRVMRCNTGLLKMIQAGLTFLDEEGQIAPDGVFQFNFQFSLEKDMHAQESIDLLQRSGIQFAKHETEGIRKEDFGELLLTSGLLFNWRVTWITFHCTYDVGYLMSAILLKPLPTDEQAFLNLLRQAIPNLIDIKELIQHPAPIDANIRHGLQDIADQLQVKRLGTAHLAGSDSILTGQTFFKIKEIFFYEDWEGVERSVNGKPYGFMGSATLTAL